MLKEEKVFYFEVTQFEYSQVRFVTWLESRVEFTRDQDDDLFLLGSVSLNESFVFLNPVATRWIRKQDKSFVITERKARNSWIVLRSAKGARKLIKHTFIRKKLFAQEVIAIAQPQAISKIYCTKAEVAVEFVQLPLGGQK